MGKKRQAGTGGVYRNNVRVHDLTIDEAFDQGIPAQVYDRIRRARVKFERSKKRKRDRLEGFADVKGKK